MSYLYDLVNRHDFVQIFKINAERGCSKAG